MGIIREYQEKPFEYPAFLSQEEVENPFLVIHKLVDNCSLFDIRKAWWDILYYMIASKELDGMDAATRAQYLFVHKSMLTLTEAAFILERWGLHKKIDQIKNLKAEV